MDHTISRTVHFILRSEFVSGVLVGTDRPTDVCVWHQGSEKEWRGSGGERADRVYVGCHLLELGLYRYGGAPGRPCVVALGVYLQFLLNGISWW